MKYNKDKMSSHLIKQHLQKLDQDILQALQVHPKQTTITPLEQPTPQTNVLAPLQLLSDKLVSNWHARRYCNQ